MIGFDTNVLVRLIVADDPRQAEQARQFVLDNCSAEDPGFVGCVVLAEAIWVLESAYGMHRDDIVRAVQRLLAAPEFLLQDHSLVRAALYAFERTAVGFTDLLIAETNRANGCKTTVTFDRKAAKFEGFTLIR